MHILYIYLYIVSCIHSLTSCQPFPLSSFQGKTEWFGSTQNCLSDLLVAGVEPSCARLASMSQHIQQAALPRNDVRSFAEKLQKYADVFYIFSTWSFKYLFHLKLIKQRLCEVNDAVRTPLQEPRPVLTWVLPAKRRGSADQQHQGQLLSPPRPSWPFHPTQTHNNLPIRPGMQLGGEAKCCLHVYFVQTFYTLDLYRSLHPVCAYRKALCSRTSRQSRGSWVSWSQDVESLEPLEPMNWTQSKVNLRWIQIGADSPSWAWISEKKPNVRASRVVGRFLGSGFPKPSHLAASKSNTKHSRANFTVSVYFIHSIFIAFLQETHWKKQDFTEKTVSS